MKKKTPANLLIDKENDKLEDSSVTFRAPATSRYGAFETHIPPAQWKNAEPKWHKSSKGVVRPIDDSEMSNSTSKTLRFVDLYGLSYDGSEIPPAVLRVTQIFENPQFFMTPMPLISFKVCLAIAGSYLHSQPCPLLRGLIQKLCISCDEEVGVYRFVFFRDSTWVSVIIDEQLFWSSPKYGELALKERPGFH
ncbi:hypothetical protein BYT27DRAFT_7251739 [Phlegmacium glaucopus]|nr:hypothetical protein BYT27DRAFT_7251739 [Phlegmacium glaucopus]